MTKRSESEQIIEIFSILGRREALTMLANSNLVERDQKLLALRFVKGMSLCECSDYFNMAVNSVAKWQTKCCRRLYEWLSNRTKAEQILDALNMQNVTYHLSENIDNTIRRNSFRLEKIVGEE